MDYIDAIKGEFERGDEEAIYLAILSFGKKRLFEWANSEIEATPLLEFLEPREIELLKGEAL